MKRILKYLALGIGLNVGLTTAVSADFFYEIKFTNLTRGQILSPLVVATHKKDFKLFELGQPASPELAALAQDAATDGLKALLDGTGSVGSSVVGSGPTPPGGTSTVLVPAIAGFKYISLASMLVTTNDAFVALNGVLRPVRLDTLKTRAPAYDAGAEDNDQSCLYIPGPPCNTPGQASDIPGEGYVFIHNGVHEVGDDLAPAIHDWHNPVAMFSIRRVNLTPEEPASEEPASEEPASEEPASEEPAPEEPAPEEPAPEEPAPEEPVPGPGAVSIGLDETVATHNAWRQQVGVQGVTWSSDVAVTAQEWANQLASQNETCTDPKHRSDLGNRNLGENLFWAWTPGGSQPPQVSPQAVVNSWGDEGQHYNAADNTCADGKVCGHYTQVVWSDTKEVGCGAATCDSSQNGPTVIWVCNYSPPGNIGGETPF